MTNSTTCRSFFVFSFYEASLTLKQDFTDLIVQLSKQKEERGKEKPLLCLKYQNIWVYTQLQGTVHIPSLPRT